MNLRRVGFVVVVLLGLSSPLHAWNDAGHMTVAYLAYQNLTPQTRSRVRALLKLNPYYKQQWSTLVPAGTSAADKDMTVFMIAATWPDEIKRDSHYKNDGSAKGDRPDGPFASRNIGYADHLRHKYWHFVDTPFTRDGTPLPPVPSPNAGTQIGVFRGVLASSSGDALKSYDLAWLLHLVGDVHQPLHGATRVTAAHPAGDNGGNGVRLTPACRGCDSELHAYWDDRFGTNAAPAEVMKAAKNIPPPDATLAAKASEADWIAESFRDADQHVYVAPIGADEGPFSLSSAYTSEARTLVTERLALAGARLANLLNTELK